MQTFPHIDFADLTQVQQDALIDYADAEGLSFETVTALQYDGTLSWDFVSDCWLR